MYYQYFNTGTILLNNKREEGALERILLYGLSKREV
jgi:hypothetical protein